MKYSLDISNFHKVISRLSHSVAFLFFPFLDHNLAIAEGLHNWILPLWLFLWLINLLNIYSCLCQAIVAACRLTSSCVRRLQLWHAGVRCGMWDLSSLTGDQTGVPCIGNQILNLWITREVPVVTFSFFFLREDQRDVLGFPGGASG